jgi:hypothetical protein
LDIPLTLSSIIIFIFTLGVGYLLLLWAYSDSDRLDEWYALDAFDKTVQTLIIGGTVTFFSLLIQGAPLAYLTSGTPNSDTFWWNWFYMNLGGIIIAESIVFLLAELVLRLILSREVEIDYVT